MALEVITREDLQQFRHQLLQELKQLLASNASEPPKKWVKSGELQELLEVSAAKLQTLRINGTLQYTKIGGTVYYDFEHIQKLMKENLRVATKN
jgi:hypothetical protein